jgi:hypothetical protein
VNGRAQRRPGQPHDTDTSKGIDRTCVHEASCRVEAAAALLSYGLLGQVPLVLAAEGAIRLLERAYRFVEAA